MMINEWRKRYKEASDTISQVETDVEKHIGFHLPDKGNMYLFDSKGDTFSKKFNEAVKNKNKMRSMAIRDGCTVIGVRLMCATSTGYFICIDEDLDTIRNFKVHDFIYLIEKIDLLELMSKYSNKKSSQ